VPLLAPLLVLGGGRVLAALTDLLGFPARGPEGRVGGLNRTSNEDYSAFGPIGAIVLLGVSAFTVLAYLRRRVDVRHLALAVALPSFVVLLALYAGFNYWMPRFLLVPAALTAPLLATLFWSRTVTAAYVVVSSVVVYLLLVHIPTKPLDGPDGRPWEITRAEASTLNGLTEIREALPAFERAVPPRACVGAVMDGEEPTYLFWGAELDRRISYLPVHGAVNEALRRGLFYVVISSGPNGWVADEFRAAGWDVRKLGDYWPLAVAPGAATGDCSAD
jgi:hypothetical protein